MGVSTTHMESCVDTGDVTSADLAAVERTAIPLESHLGYLTAKQSDDNAMPSSYDPYHVNTVWPFEQAIIHAAARRHGSVRAELVYI
jgi:hypothetical protein